MWNFNLTLNIHFLLKNQIFLPKNVIKKFAATGFRSVVYRREILFFSNVNYRIQKIATTSNLISIFSGEMIDKLTLAFNRTRQAVITRELIEIISGAACV